MLWRPGQIDEAMAHYQKALEIKPDYAEAHNNLGIALAGRGRIDEAIAHYQKALEIKPDYAEAHNNLGIVLAGRGQDRRGHRPLPEGPGTQARLRRGPQQPRPGLWPAADQIDEAIAHYQQGPGNQARLRRGPQRLGRGSGWPQGKLHEALAHYQKALEIKPDNIEAHANLGNALLGLGRWDEALEHLRKVVELSPEGAVPRNTLGAVLATLGRFDEALAQFQKALQIQPNYAEARKNLAWLRATCPQASLRNGAEAIEHARRADQLCGGKRADVLDVLAAAYAEAGRFPEALATARKALELATQQNARALADALRTRIALYEAGKPFHLAPPKH